MILVGTERGLSALGHDGLLLARPVTALDARGGTAVTLTDDGAVLLGDAFEHTATVPNATCVLAARAGLFVGGADARLHRIDGARAEHVAGFDAADDRARWYTPWGGLPDVRSMSESDDGAVFVNVHVGGILRSTDGGQTWMQTIDIDADIHQVLVHDGRVFAPGADALHISHDGGATWAAHTDGFEHTYLRAVAIAGSTVLVSAARDHSGGDPGIYRRALDDDGPFRRCAFDGPVSERNIDTAWLAADGPRAAFVTAEGDAWASDDEGASWERIARGLPAPRCLSLT